MDSRAIINIGRQIGSGGLAIARMLAKDMGCKFYDRELLNLAARESGFHERFFENRDEHVGFLKNMFHLTVGDPASNKLSQESLFHFQSDAIRKAADEHSCVFVGRCADYVLRDYPNKVDVFITANWDERVRRVMERHACTEAEAAKIIEAGEKGRSSYYNYYTGKRWGDGKSYDLCINSSVLGARATADFIMEFARRKLGMDA